MQKINQPSATILNLAKAPKENHLNDLIKYSSSELLELRDRQLKLLANK